MKFLVLNGVNLNLTGKREKGVYGTQTLDEINAKIAAYCEKNGDSVEFYQSNIEGPCDLRRWHRRDPARPSGRRRSWAAADRIP